MNAVSYILNNRWSSYDDKINLKRIKITIDKNIMTIDIDNKKQTEMIYLRRSLFFLL